MPWYVYILKCSDGTLYCGITCDVTRRIDEHNGLLPGGARYTCSRRPVLLVSSAPFANRSEASRAEYRIKKVHRDKKVSLLNEFAKGIASNNQSQFFQFSKKNKESK